MASGPLLSLPEKILLEMAYDGDYELRQALVWLRSELPGFESRPDWTELRGIAHETIRSLIERELIYLEYRRCKDGNCEWREIPKGEIDDALQGDEPWHFGEIPTETNAHYDDVVLFATEKGELLYESGAALR